MAQLKGRHIGLRGETWPTCRTEDDAVVSGCRRSEVPTLSRLSLVWLKETGGGGGFLVSGATETTDQASPEL